MGYTNLTLFIFKDNKEDLITDFYRQESEEWHRLIHKRGSILEENVKDTCDSIEEGSIIYTVYEGNRLVAFFIKYETDGKQILNGFHVLKEYRNKEFLTEFWIRVKSIFGESIYTGIYCKNEPAIKSLMKAGFVINNMVLHDNKVFLILKFN